jgi:hypothetical protein
MARELGRNIAASEGPAYATHSRRPLATLGGRDDELELGLSHGTHLCADLQACIPLLLRPDESLALPFDTAADLVGLLKHELSTIVGGILEDTKNQLDDMGDAVCPLMPTSYLQQRNDLCGG